MSYKFRSSRQQHSRPRSNNRRYSRKTGQNINPSRFVKAATATEAEVYVPKQLFSDFDIRRELKVNLEDKGYKMPSPIQDQTIGPALEGRDIIGIASTGTGKTAAFLVPILNKLSLELNSKALIIAPTRELAQQIDVELKALGKGSGIKSTIIIGGARMGYQLRDLKQNPRVVIGTPGRIKDHINRGTLRLQDFNVVVLDEVDRMLDMGFVHDVKTILGATSSNKQSFFFSATIDERVKKLLHGFTNDPFVVSLKSTGGSENVHQDVVRYNGRMDKMEKLHDILIKNEVSKAIVFEETQRGVERLNSELIDRGFSTDAIHGGKSQGQRQRALAKFKRSDVNILVATDVAARGIDVVDISHVINFSTPSAYEDYIHRIGRAGRAGRIGYALTFVA